MAYEPAGSGRSPVAVVSVVLFAASLLGIAAGLRVLTPLEGYATGRKLERVLASGDEFSVILIGSSHINSGFDPAAFDAVTASAGCATTTYNLGVPGMNPPRMKLLVDRLVEAELPSLHTLILERHWTLADPQQPGRNEEAPEFIAWHDVSGTAVAVGAEILAEEPLGYRVDGIRAHLTAFLRRATSFGLGARWLQTGGRPPQLRSDAVQVAADGNGYTRKSWPLEDPAGFKKMVAKLAAERAEPSSPPRGERFRAATHERVVEWARAEGLDAWSLAFPDVRDSIAKAAFREPPEQVFAYDDPRSHPALYEARYRRRPSYLNETGSAVFSRTLARDWTARAGCSGAPIALR